MNTSTLLSIIIAIMLAPPSPAGGDGNVICCGFDENGNNVCYPAGASGCGSGEKAVVCRYGFWTDPDSGIAECWPTP
jgi:hypothetical protein